MITLERFGELPARARGAYLAIGNFDGVHLGHARLIARLRALADEAGVPAVAVTFDPPPAAILRPQYAPAPLTWIERRAELLQQAGAHDVVVFRTGAWLLNLTAREFFDRIILEQFDAKGMVEGPNFSFGRDRGGDTRLLGAWCAERGIPFEVADPSELGDRMISSSRIRKALDLGEPDEALRMLGRPHRIRGVVTHGAGRGAGLGVATANLDEIDTVIPADGVYAALAYRGPDLPPIPAACNIGPNPTFGEQIRKVEAHLIDFSGDLYGETLALDFLARLRPTRKFSGLDDLLAQIHTDIARAKEVGGAAIAGP